MTVPSSLQLQSECTKMRNHFRAVFYPAVRTCNRTLMSPAALCGHVAWWHQLSHDIAHGLSSAIIHLASCKRLCSSSRAWSICFKVFHSLGARDAGRLEFLLLLSPSTASEMGNSAPKIPGLALASSCYPLQSTFLPRRIACKYRSAKPELMAVALVFCLASSRSFQPLSLVSLC